ncbi:hypothetical protein L211DRAFT_142106 [Terfezia boudieri ATCC MYA-4762]|uniref:Uncharacterized protein n=1 Tax=Terfezia boudieri ATCC MYA-4762 TaxID=1051890 RepID=A0A3N4M2Z4_9PEZI|nr:hypothetical protein L211DRAFT_142106 [Terfezia boudieri ATCC MYA-4762]
MKIQRYTYLLCSRESVLSLCKKRVMHSALLLTLLPAPTYVVLHAPFATRPYSLVHRIGAAT